MQTTYSPALVAAVTKYKNQFSSAWVGLDVVMIMKRDGVYEEIVGGSHASTTHAADAAAYKILGHDKCRAIESSNNVFVTALYR
jgi:hypothetical protein